MRLRATSMAGSTASSGGGSSSASSSFTRLSGRPDEAGRGGPVCGGAILYDVDVVKCFVTIIVNEARRMDDQAQAAMARASSAEAAAARSERDAEAVRQRAATDVAAAHSSREAAEEEARGSRRGERR